MDELILQLRISGVDYVILYQLARREKMTVEEWIRKTIIEKIEIEQQKMITPPIQERKGEQ
jgi:hypothetical protein